MDEPKSLLEQADAVIGQFPQKPEQPTTPLLEQANRVISGKPPEMDQQEVRYNAAREWAGNRLGSEKELGGVGIRDILESAIPFGSAAYRFNEAKKYKEAKEAYDKKEATDAQLGVLAQQDLRNERQQSQGLGRRAAGAAMQAPAIIGEAAAGGALVRGAASALGAGGLVSGASTGLGRIAQAAGTQALATPAMPSMYLEESVKRSEKNGGEWYEPKNVAPALAKAAVTNAILGQIGQMAGQVPGGLAGRVAAGAAAMPIEQAGADVLVSSVDKAMEKAGIDKKWQTDTKFGTLGLLAEGKYGDAMQEVALQAFIGGGMAAFHGSDHKPIDSFKKSIDKLADAGIPPEQAGPILKDALTKPPESLPAGPIRDFVEEVAKSNQQPEQKATETPKQPLPDVFAEELAKGPEQPKERPQPMPDAFAEELAKEKSPQETVKQEQDQQNPKFDNNKPIKPIWEMNGDELASAHKDAIKKEKNIDTDILGQEGAKEWNRLHRLSNSNNDEVSHKAAEAIAKIEATLSEKDYNRLYGIGEPDGPVADDYKEYRQAVSHMQENNPDSLAKRLAHVLTKLPREGTDPSKMRREEQIAYSQLREAYAIIQQNGWDPKKISRDALKKAGSRYSDPEDAYYMLRRFLKQEKPQEKPQQKQPIASSYPALEAKKPIGPEELAKPTDERPNQDLENFFSKPTEKPKEQPKGGNLRPNADLEDIMGRPAEQPKPAEPFNRDNKALEDFFNQLKIAPEPKKAPIRLGVAEDGGKTANGTQLSRHSIFDAKGNEIGEVKAFQSGETLHIEWMGKKGAAATDKEAKGGMGTRDVSDTFRQLAAAYPDAIVAKYTPAESRLNVGKTKWLDLEKIRQKEASKADYHRIQIETGNHEIQKEARNAAENAVRAGETHSSIEESLRRGEETGRAESEARYSKVPTPESNEAGRPVDSQRTPAGNTETGSPSVPGTSGRAAEPASGRVEPFKFVAPEEKGLAESKPIETVLDEIKAFLAPAAVSETSKIGAGVIRANRAAEVRSNAVGEAALKQAQDYFDNLVSKARGDEATLKDNFLAFTDPVQAGEIEKMGPEMKQFAETVRRLNDEIEQEALNRKLINQDKLIENYLGQMWADPKDPNAAPDKIGERLAQARRPLAGSEAFTKKRVLPTYREGFEAGLIPKDWNPIRTVLAKRAEVSKAIMAHDTLKELRENGQWEYVRLGKNAPKGWERIDDKAATVFAPPEAKIREYIDKQQMEGLERFAKSLGVKLERTTKGMGNTAGMHFDNEIITKFGTPEEVLAHEIGHELDRRYGMADALTQNPATQREMVNLADLRASGRVSEDFRAYLRSPEEQAANLVAAYIHAPELLRSVAPESAKWFDSLLQSHRELLPLENIKPSLELGQRDQMMRLAGPMLTGHYYTPGETARLINNYLSPGLYGNSRIYEGVRNTANVLNGFQLGFSAFHLGFVAMDTQVSAMALGLKMISRGDVGQGMKQIALGSIPGVAAVRSYLSGTKVGKEYFKPGAMGGEVAKITESLIQAGGRAKMDAFYGGTFIDSFRSALRDTMNGEMKRAPSALFHALPALQEMVSVPIMEHLVPKMKMGVYADMAKYELSKNPNMGREQLRESLGKSWDSVENRLGQLTYDNLFWNRTFKDMLMIGVRSVGWNTGTIRELGGGLKDLPKAAIGKGLTDRSAYMVALPMVAALYGSIYQYLATGEGPKDLKDMINPRTGQKRKDGSDDRVSLPSYMRDIMALSNRADEGPIRVASNAWGMAKHKLNPLVGVISEMLDNKDFYDKAIYAPQDSSVQKALALVQHVIKSFEPLAIRNIRQQQEENTPAAKTLQNLVGVTPAPSYVTRTSDQQRAIEAKQKMVTSPQQKLAIERRKSGN